MYFYLGYICCFVNSMQGFDYPLTHHCQGQSCCYESTGLKLRPKEHQEKLGGILGGPRIGLHVVGKTNSTPIGNQTPSIRFVVSVSPTAPYLLTKLFLC